MKRIIISFGAVVCTLFTIHNASAGQIYVSDFINQKNCDQIIDKKYYTICYDYNMKGARYVSYTLDGSKVNSLNIRKRPRFYIEKKIPKKYQTKSSDYTKNEFHADRGHLAPDASFDYSFTSLRSVYSMANIIPQYKKINRGTWIKAERYERFAARKYGNVNVINGVVYDKYPSRFRKSGIAYPTAYWKMIYTNDGFSRCFYYKNDPIKTSHGDKLENHIVDCNTVNRSKK